MYTDREILEQVDTYLRGSTNPDFVGYREQILQRDFLDQGRYLWLMRYLCTLGAFSGKTLLDVGCGCGWQALTMSLLGGNRVVACDILPSMIDGVADGVRSVRAQGIRCDVEPKLGDICDLDLPPRSLDGIYSLESAEHVHDLDRMFDRCVDLLKPGGKLIVVNDGNVHNRALAKATKAMWLQREHSWDWANYLRGIRPVEHADATPFRLMRQAMVMSANPDLPATAVDALVDATAGMLKPDIEKLAREYRPGVTLPAVPSLDWCRNPVTGEYAERLLDPFDLADRMRRRGLRARVHHAFRRLPFTLLNSVQFRPLNRLLFQVRAVFVILGEAAPAARGGCGPG